MREATNEFFVTHIQAHQGVLVINDSSGSTDEEDPPSIRSSLDLHAPRTLLEMDCWNRPGHLAGVHSDFSVFPAPPSSSERVLSNGEIVDVSRDEFVAFATHRLHRLKRNLLGRRSVTPAFQGDHAPVWLLAHFPEGGQIQGPMRVCLSPHVKAKGQHTSLFPAERKPGVLSFNRLFSIWWVVVLFSLYTVFFASLSLWRGDEQGVFWLSVGVMFFVTGLVFKRLKGFSNTAFDTKSGKPTTRVDVW